MSAQMSSGRKIRRIFESVDAAREWTVKNANRINDIIGIEYK
jgi:hypothetical protein